jgi:putative peptidoglycan lipid II flippase
MAYLLSLSLSKSSKSTLLVGGLTVFSRLLGFWRDVLIARYFGVNLATDAFFAAFRFPNLLRRLFAEGAFSQAFVPTLTLYKTKNNTDEIQQFINKITSYLTLFMLIVTFFGVMIAPILILVCAAGFDWQSQQHQLATQLLQIMLPYGIFITLTALMGSILNTYTKFAIPAFTPALLNISMIAATFWLTPYFQQPIIALAVGVFIGGALHQLRLLPKLQRNFHNNATRRVMNNILPTIFANSTTQINFLVNTLIASFLGTGSVSWLYYADRLLEFPSGILGSALTTVMLPKLAKNYIAHESEKFSQTLDWGLHCIALLGVPASIGLFFLSEPILSVLFGSTEFTAYDVHACAQALSAYVLGLIGFLMVKVLTPAFTTCHIQSIAIRYAWICLGVNLILVLLLIQDFAHIGIALASSLATSLNAALLLIFLWKKQVYKPPKNWRVFSLQILFSSAVLTETLRYFSSFASLSAFYLVKCVILGGASYFAGLFLSGYFYTHKKNYDF